MDLAYVREENLLYLPKTFKKDIFYEMIDAILEAEDNKLSIEFGNGLQRSREKNVRRDSALKIVIKLLIDIRPFCRQSRECLGRCGLGD